MKFMAYRFFRGNRMSIFGQFGIFVLALFASTAASAGYVTESRSASAYQGDWEGVQWGGVIWQWKGSAITVKKSVSGNFYRAGDVAIRSISSTSSPYKDSSWSAPRQVFRAECLLRETVTDRSTTYLPCMLVLEDSNPAYPPIRTRFSVIMEKTAKDFNKWMKLPHGYFDPIK